MFRNLLLFSCLFAIVKTVFPQDDSTTNPLKNYIFSRSDQVEKEKRLLSSLNPDSIASLPFGIDKEMGITRYIVVIDTARYFKQAAVFSAYAAITFPGTDKRLAFAAFGIRFNPKGVMSGSQARLMLVSEHYIEVSPNLRIKFPADGNNFVEWDCKGFKAISLKGEFEFNPARIIPDSTQTREKIVKGSFQIYTNDIHNFITQVNITPFCIRGLRGWSFKVTNATVDFSELANAPGMLFPIGYANTSPVWTGFYLQEVKVKLPSEISRQGTRTEITAHHMLIDNMGVSGLFRAANLFGTREGNMNGWGFSVDELGVSILCNQLSGGFLKGKVEIPIVDSVQALVYSATILYNPQRKEAEYIFSLNPQDNLKFNVFSAKVDIFPSSTIVVNKINGVLVPKAILNGKIAFTEDKLKTGKLLFQDLMLITEKPYITGGVFSLTSDSVPKMGGFSVRIDHLALLVHPQSPRIYADVSFALMEQKDKGFSAGTKVQITGKITEEIKTVPGDIPRTYTKTKWKFDKAEIASINLDVATSVFYLKGIAVFHDKDPVYGSGFFGKLKFSVQKTFPDSTTMSSTVCFGQSAFKYWYADVQVPVSIKMGSITLTSIIGGMYYQMKPQRQKAAEYIRLASGEIVPNAMSQGYYPDKTVSLGFKVGTTYKHSLNERTLNGDAMLEIGFNDHGGLSYVSLDGNAYMMSTLAERKTKLPPVAGNIFVQYDVENKVFDASLKVDVNAYNTINGTGYGKIHIDPEVWFVCAGKPLNMLSVGVKNLASAHGYFMVGNTLEAMAPVPTQVSQVVRDHGLDKRRDQPALTQAKGFCSGVRFASSFYKSFGWDFFSVYGGFEYGAGFDMMLVNYGSRAHCSGGDEPAGLNGWLASGQLYIYLQGNIGVKGHIRFAPKCDAFCILDTDFDIPILSGTVAAVVEGKLPNPSFVSGKIGCRYSILGRIEGHFDFDYQLGKDCVISGN